MKKVIKAAEEMTEEEKKEWLRNASAEDLLSCYESLHTETIKGWSYNPDFNLTRAEMLRRLGGNAKEADVSSGSSLDELVTDLIYQVWENSKGEGLSSVDVVDEVIDHIDMLNNEDELDVYLPDDWRKQVGNIVTSHYDEYEW